MNMVVVKKYCSDEPTYKLNKTWIFCHILKRSRYLISSYLKKKHASLRLQAYFWFLELLKVEWQEEPSTAKPILGRTSSQFGFRKQRCSLVLGLDI